MARKRQEDQVPWLFFFVMFQSRCDYFPSVRFFHSTWQGLTFFRGRTSTSSSTTMRIMSDDDKYLWVYDLMTLRCNFTTYTTFLFKGTKLWQDACHVLETRASSYLWRTFLFSQKLENSILRFPLFIELFFAPKISVKSYLLEIFLIICPFFVWKKMFLFSEIRKF